MMGTFQLAQLLEQAENVGAKILATESKKQEHAQAYDFSNLVSEHEYASTVVATNSLQQNIKNTLGEKTLTSWQQNPRWDSLVTAWEYSTQDSFPEELRSLEVAVKHFWKTPKTQDLMVGGLLPKAVANTSDDKQVLETLEQLIETKLDSLVENNQTKLEGKALRANTAYKQVSGFWE